MAALTDILGQKVATYGYYSQVKKDEKYDGSQLLQVKDDVKSSGAIFEPAIMPTGGFGGMTEDDDSQAQAIADVVKQFTDDGIEVRVRFGHEISEYSLMI